MAIRKPSEQDLVRSVLTLLSLHGIPSWRANSGGGLRPNGRGGMRPVQANPPGTPDVLAILPPAGRLAGIELKSRKGRLRESQVAWQATARRAGALIIVARSLNEVVLALRAEGYLR